jgi:hypothetical protein
VVKGGEKRTTNAVETREKISRAKISWKECVWREEDCGEKVRDVIYYWNKKWMMGGKREEKTRRIIGYGRYNEITLVAKTRKEVRQPLLYHQ